MSGFVKEFGARFKDFAEIGKLSQLFKSLYEAALTAEWADMTTKLFNLEKSLF